MSASRRLRYFPTSVTCRRLRLPVAPSRRITAPAPAPGPELAPPHLSFLFSIKAAADSVEDSPRRKQRLLRFLPCSRCGLICSCCGLICLRRQKPHQDAFLDVHPVGRLLDHDTLRPVDYFVGHFVAPVDRKSTRL